MWYLIHKFRSVSTILINQTHSIFYLFLQKCLKNRHAMVQQQVSYSRGVNAWRHESRMTFKSQKFRLHDISPWPFGRKSFSTVILTYQQLSEHCKHHHIIRGALISVKTIPFIDSKFNSSFHLAFQLKLLEVKTHQTKASSFFSTSIIIARKRKHVRASQRTPRVKHMLWVHVPLFDAKSERKRKDHLNNRP